MVVLGLFVSALFLVASPAQAHPADVPDHFSQNADDYNAHDGPLGHCASSAFCSGVAILGTLRAGSISCGLVARYDIPVGTFRVMVVTEFDPPPPRFLM